MADFTYTVQEILEHPIATDLGLGSYPIFDENYRPILNEKIINHYYYDEIAHESIDMFVRQMRTKMAEIMPYYNQLYKSQLLTIDPMSTQDVTTTNSGSSTSDMSQSSSQTSNTKSTGNDENTGTTKSASKSRAVNSEFPQVRLSGNQDYATNAADSTSDADGVTTGKGHQESTQTSDMTAGGSSKNRSSQANTAHSTGRSAPMTQLLMQWRETFINVDLMVIAELQPLFMQVWTNGNNYFSRGLFDYAY